MTNNLPKLPITRCCVPWLCVMGLLPINGPCCCCCCGGCCCCCCWPVPGLLLVNCLLLPWVVWNMICVNFYNLNINVAAVKIFQGFRIQHSSPKVCHLLFLKISLYINFYLNSWNNSTLSCIFLLVISQALWTILLYSYSLRNISRNLFLQHICK